MPETVPLLHIGYHKTGSTLLQDNFFNDPDGTFAIPDAPRHQLVERFVVPAPYHFDATTARAPYEAFLRASANSGKIPVLSHERFSGYPPSGGFDSPLIAERLATSFPRARVLIVLREQCASIRSMYSQYITDGGDMSFAAYVSQPQAELSRMPGFSKSFYCYDGLIAQYQALFGAERVLVLPYELLRTEPDVFAARICTFAEAPFQSIAKCSVNTARPLAMQAAQRRINRWLSDNQLSRSPLIKVPRATKGFARTRSWFEKLVPPSLNDTLDNRLKARVAKTFAGAFAASNVRTATLTGLPLATYGYQWSGNIDAAPIDTANQLKERPTP